MVVAVLVLVCVIDVAVFVATVVHVVATAVVVIFAKEVTDCYKQTRIINYDRKSFDRGS